MVQNRCSVVSEIQVAELDLPTDFCSAGTRAQFHRVAVIDLRLLHQNLVDASHRRGAALENINHPAQGDHGPCELHHVGIKCDEITNRHAAQQYLASS